MGVIAALHPSLQSALRVVVRDIRADAPCIPVEQRIHVQEEKNISYARELFQRMRVNKDEDMERSIRT